MHRDQRMPCARQQVGVNAQSKPPKHEDLLRRAPARTSSRDSTRRLRKIFMLLLVLRRLAIAHTTRVLGLS